ncbi:MAG: aminopeptidase P family protein [Candidatus Ancillula sp.]|jgi:Xaa-Pro aminopeptidase|nr:aminopeptidase P family protein [Candidatus Ancillula sp.]
MVALKQKEDRGSNRLRKVENPGFKKFMTEGWDKKTNTPLDVAPHSQFAQFRQQYLSDQFPKDRLIIEAGDYKVRNNDCNYRFRPYSAFTYYTCMGMDYEPGAVLVFEPIKIEVKEEKKWSHVVTLYVPEPKGRTTSEFYEDPIHGEFWIGARPELANFQEQTGISTKPLSELKNDLKKYLPVGGKTRYLREEDSDQKLEEVASEQRLIKDAWEVEQMRLAIKATKVGFDRVISKLNDTIDKPRGERIVEGNFNAAAIEYGNCVGYETIAASGDHATTLHWIRNNGVVKSGDLLLLDAGVEVDSLYTADVTRTLPINGEFTFWQRQVYTAVLEAANAGFKKAVPGNKFKDVHDAAMEVLAEKLKEMGILKVSVEEALSEKGMQYRRWMCHGTSHHLGIDVHDCAAARASMYMEGELKPGMIFTIEPGLYFKSDDLFVPKDYRGIGVRIEDDILITEDGAEYLTKDFPRNPEHVESWVKTLRNQA